MFAGFSEQGLIRERPLPSIPWKTEFRSVHSESCHSGGQGSQQEFHPLSGIIDFSRFKDLLSELRALEPGRPQNLTCLE